MVQRILVSFILLNGPLWACAHSAQHYSREELLALRGGCTIALDLAVLDNLREWGIGLPSAASEEPQITLPFAKAPNRKRGPKEDSAKGSKFGFRKDRPRRDDKRSWRERDDEDQ